MDMTVAEELNIQFYSAFWAEILLSYKSTLVYVVFTEIRFIFSV
jgi:hypothetical protein